MNLLCVFSLVSTVLNSRNNLPAVRRAQIRAAPNVFLASRKLDDIHREGSLPVLQFKHHATRASQAKEGGLQYNHIYFIL